MDLTPECLDLTDPAYQWWRYPDLDIFWHAPQDILRQVVQGLHWETPSWTDYRLLSLILSPGLRTFNFLQARCLNFQSTGVCAHMSNHMCTVMCHKQTPGCWLFLWDAPLPQPTLRIARMFPLSRELENRLENEMKSAMLKKKSCFGVPSVFSLPSKALSPSSLFWPKPQTILLARSTSFPLYYTPWNSTHTNLGKRNLYLQTSQMIELATVYYQKGGGGVIW